MCLKVWGSNSFHMSIASKAHLTSSIVADSCVSLFNSLFNSLFIELYAEVLPLFMPTRQQRTSGKLNFALLHFHYNEQHRHRPLASGDSPESSHPGHILRFKLQFPWQTAPTRSIQSISAPISMKVWITRFALSIQKANNTPRTQRDQTAYEFQRIPWLIDKKSARRHNQIRLKWFRRALKLPLVEPKSFWQVLNKLGLSASSSLSFWSF